MSLQIRIEEGVAILSSVGGLMNDPRYVDASRDVKGLLDEGIKAFVIEMRGVHEAGGPLLGLLMTMTREIRRRGGEVALANVGKGMQAYLAGMMMEEFWDTYRGVDEAKSSFARPHDADRP